MRSEIFIESHGGNVRVDVIAANFFPVKAKLLGLPDSLFEQRADYIYYKPQVGDHVQIDMVSDMEINQRSIFLASIVFPDILDSFHAFLVQPGNYPP